jgi:hypothetical protein
MVKHLLVSPRKPPSAADLRAAWVDLEPPLTAAGSGPAMAARVGPRRGAARRRRVHPSAGARGGERARGGAILLRVAHRPTSAVARSLRCAGRALPRSRSTAARPPIGGRAHRREDPWRCRRGASCGARREEARMNPRVRARAPTAFCSARIHAWLLDADGRLTFNGPSRGPGGTQLSRPRPTTRPGARSALCASGPTGRFRAGSRPGARNALCASGPTGRFHFRVGFEL